MKIYVTGLKGSGKSFLIDQLKERYDNSNLQKIFIADFDTFCYYEEGKYTNPIEILKVIYQTYNHVIISGSPIIDSSFVDKLFFIDINFGTWIAQLKNRFESGRVNSNFSKVKDSELIKYTPKQFNDYKQEKLDLVNKNSNFEIITLSNLVKLITNEIDKFYN